MLEILKTIWTKKAFIVFIIALVCLLPQAVSRPAQMSTKAILTEITISKSNDAYKIDALQVKSDINKPEQITGSGKFLAHAINSISSATGRQVSFAHCTQIIIGDGMENENLVDLLKYFIYRTELNNNCAIAWLKKGRTTTLERFYKDYKDENSTSHMAYGNKTAIFKNSVFFTELSEDQTDAYQILNKQKLRKRLSYDNEVLQITSNSCKYTNNKIDVKLTLLLESNPYADDSLISDIKSHIEKQIRKSLFSTLVTINPEEDIARVIKVDVTVTK